MLTNLKYLREHPPSLDVSVDLEVVDSGNVQSSDSNNVTADADANADSIDWDFSVDSSQIDWDIGTVEEAEDAGNGLGPYEMVNASEILQSSPNEAAQSDLVPEVSVSEISWDISVETPQVDTIDDVNLSNVVENQTSVLDTSTQTTEIKEGRSQLLETEYRNKILDDLNEVYDSLLYGLYPFGLLLFFFVYFALVKLSFLKIPCDDC